MRLLNRNGTYYVEFPGDKRRSLRTKDKREAQRLFKELKTEIIKGELKLLKKSQSMDIAEFCTAYISHPDRIGLSSSTHRADLIAFKSLQSVIGNIDISNIELKHITEFKAYCQTTDIKPVSINTYLRHIKAGLNFALKQEWSTSSVPDIKYLKTPQAIVRVISSDNIKAILDTAQNEYPEMYRIIMFVLFTGCRRSEIIKMEYQHIDWSTKEIRIQGKGDKERIIYLLPESINCLYEFQDIGKVFSYNHVSTLTNYFHKIISKCGFNARFHDLRHTAATQMISSGIPVEVVQKILGHSAISTTQIYAQVVAEKMKSEMGKLKY